MAAPNIFTSSTVLGKTVAVAVTTTPTAFLENTADSGKVYKINLIIAANIDGTNNADITVDLFRNSTAFHLAKTVSIPADSSFEVINKSFYMEEGDTLRCSANANGDIELICSYEEIG